MGLPDTEIKPTCHEGGDVVKTKYNTPESAKVLSKSINYVHLLLACLQKMSVFINIIKKHINIYMYFFTISFLSKVIYKKKKKGLRKELV